jgi:hypothetical protein
MVALPHAEHHRPMHEIHAEDRDQRKGSDRSQQIQHDFHRWTSCGNALSRQEHDRLMKELICLPNISQ